MDPKNDPITMFINSTENLIKAVVGKEMSKHGLISKYPENFNPDVEKAKKEMYDFMTSQDPDAVVVSEVPKENEEA